MVGSEGVNFINRFRAKNKKIGFYPKALRPFLRIARVVDNPRMYMHAEELLVRNQSQY